MPNKLLLVFNRAVKPVNFESAIETTRLQERHSVYSAIHSGLLAWTLNIENVIPYMTMSLADKIKCIYLHLIYGYRM